MNDKKAEALRREVSRLKAATNQIVTKPSVVTPLAVNSGPIVDAVSSDRLSND